MDESISTLPQLMHLRVAACLINGIFGVAFGSVSVTKVCIYRSSSQDDYRDPSICTKRAL